MKHKTVRFLSFLSALCMVTAQSVPALAADSTQETNIAGNQSAIVNYEQASAFSVTIPKAIVLNSNKNAAYNVKVKGDIAGNESVTVIPDATVTLNDANGKTPVTGTIDQVKTEFLCNEIATDDGCSTDGKITAEDLTSGDWSGVFKFEIGTNAGIGDEVSLTSNNLTTYNIDTVGDVVIPSFVTDDDNTRHAVTCISDYAFRDCTEMTSVAIADSVTKVGTGAFANCSKLSNVTIPNSVKSIGNSVFDGCPSLSVINYNGNEYDSSNVESAFEENGITIGDNIFDHSYGQPVYTWSDDNASCTATKTCSECHDTITETVEVSQQTTDATCTNEGLSTYKATFKNSDFESQTKTSKISAVGHKSVSANNAVAATCTTDGKESDTVCSVCGVTLTTGKTITKTGHKYGTPTYTWSNDGKACVAKRVCANDSTHIETENGTITNKVKTPATYTTKGTTTYTATFKNTAFKTQTKDIQNIPVLEKLGADITLASNNLATYGISTKGDVEIPKYVTDSDGTKHKVVGLKNYVFKGCKGLTSITMPNSVTSIGIGAFEGCKGLTSITIPNSVTSIRAEAFYNCSGLTSITIPDSATSIGTSAFQGCTGLTSITIPNSVTSIGIEAFSGCSGLTSITIPDNVTSIGNSAFYGCSGLKSITIPNSVTNIGDCAFGDCTKLASVTYKGQTYTSKSALTATLKNNVTVYENSFDGTALTN